LGNWIITLKGGKKKNKNQGIIDKKTKIAEDKGGGEKRVKEKTHPHRAKELSHQKKGSEKGARQEYQGLGIAQEQVKKYCLERPYQSR